jgi:hypothetical protein
MFLDRRQCLAAVGAFADDFDLRFVFGLFEGACERAVRRR